MFKIRYGRFPCWMLDFRRIVQYEWLPQFCFNRGHMNHTMNFVIKSNRCGGSAMPTYER